MAYTGTHDNETLAGWFDTITKEEQMAAREYLCDQRTAKKSLHKSFIALILRSSAKCCIIPIQDYLGLDRCCQAVWPHELGRSGKENGCRRILAIQNRLICKKDHILYKGKRKRRK